MSLISTPISFIADCSIWWKRKHPVVGCRVFVRRISLILSVTTIILKVYEVWFTIILGI